MKGEDFVSKYIPKIIGEKIYLSPMFLDDLEQYTRWMNDIEVVRYLNHAANVYILEKEKEVLERMVREGYNFAIVLKEEHRLIGNCSLLSVNHLHQTAEVGIFIGDLKERNKGYGQETVRLLVKYGFEYLNLNNIMLRVFSSNQSAINSYIKCGFRQFGKRTRSCYTENKWHDEIYMEILKDGFK